MYNYLDPYYIWYLKKKMKLKKQNKTKTNKQKGSPVLKNVSFWTFQNLIFFNEVFIYNDVLLKPYLVK